MSLLTKRTSFMICCGSVSVRTSKSCNSWMAFIWRSAISFFSALFHGLYSRASFPLNLKAGDLSTCWKALFWLRRVLMCWSFVTSGECVGLGTDSVENGGLWWVWGLYRVWGGVTGLICGWGYWVVAVVLWAFDWIWSILCDMWTMSACSLAFSLCMDINMSFMLWISGATCEVISSRVACWRAASKSVSRGELLTFVLKVEGDVSRDACCGGWEFITSEGPMLCVGALLYGI